MKTLTQILIVLFTVGCTSSPSPTSVLESVEPQVVQLPSRVTLNGLELGYEDPEHHLVAWTLDEVEPTRFVLDDYVETWTDTEIQFTLPEEFLGSMYAERPFALNVEKGDALSNCLRIDAVLPPDPRVSNISPPVTEADTVLLINGISFGEETGAVRFAPGVDASVLSWAEEEILVLVPAGGDGGSFRVETSLGLLSKPYPFILANPDEVTLNLLQSVIFTPSCALGSCHGAALAAGLSLVEGESYQNLVSVASEQLAGVLRVEPFSPESSFLLDKLESPMPQLGLRMPLGGPFLSAEQIGLIRTWIERGAMDD